PGGDARRARAVAGGEPERAHPGDEVRRVPDVAYSSRTEASPTPTWSLTEARPCPSSHTACEPMKPRLLVPEPPPWMSASPMPVSTETWPARDRSARMSASP